MQNKKMISLTLFLPCLMTACSYKAPTPNTVQAPTKPMTVQQSNIQSNPQADNSQTLASMTWQLTQLQTANQASSTKLKSGDEANRIQMTLKEGRISISGGCNTMMGSAEVSPGNKLNISPLAGTRRACMGSLMQTDSEISDYLSRVTNYSLSGNTLKLTTNDNETLTFTGTETEETKYGKGERKFIEIRSSEKGITWREAKYNKNWIRIKDNAPWLSNFPGIKNFTPKTNMHYIVRLFEYQDSATQKKIWVKDMVTTTGILDR